MDPMACPPPRERRPLEGAQQLSPKRLLSFYDRLRVRVLRAVRSRGGRFAAPVAEALLLVPDLFVLLARLLLDREVPSEARALIGGALAYFLLPIDLLPEAFVGIGGYLDGLVLASAVLTQALGGDLEPWASKYWNGNRDLRRTLHDVASSARALLGRDLYGRLERALSKRGVELRA